MLHRNESICHRGSVGGMPRCNLVDCPASMTSLRINLARRAMRELRIPGVHGNPGRAADGRAGETRPDLGCETPQEGAAQSWVRMGQPLQPSASWPCPRKMIWIGVPKRVVTESTGRFSSLISPSMGGLSSDGFSFRERTTADSAVSNDELGASSAAGCPFHGTSKMAKSASRLDASTRGLQTAPQYGLITKTKPGSEWRPTAEQLKTA